MSNFEDFMSKMNPKFAAKVKTAQEVETVRYPTASLTLNRALGGGVPKGRISLWFGDTSAGKTAVALQSIGKWQAQGLVCGFIDVEGTYDREWAAKLGVNNDELIVVQTTKSSGRVEDGMKPFLDAGIDILVIDSISDIMPETFVDKEGNLNDQGDRKQIGAHAKAITALFNGIHYMNEGTAVIAISQTTTSINNTYVEQIPHGGKKAAFASSQIVRFSSSPSPNKQIYEDVEENGVVVSRPVARDVTCQVTKNKVGQPYLTGGWRFNYGIAPYGIDNYSELITVALESGVVTKGGAWVYFGDDLKWNGKDRLREALVDDKALFDELEAAVFGLG